MNSDASEAVLGLLSLSPFNTPQSHPQPQPHPHHHVPHPHGPSLTSPSVGIAVDRTSAPHIVQSALPPSLVPLKRKQPSPFLSATALTPPLPGTSRDALSTKPCPPSNHLITSSTPPIPTLPSLSTKSLQLPSQRHVQQRPFSPALSSSITPQTPPSQHPLTSPSTSQHPLSLSDVPPPPDSDAISCICGFTYDDGFSIACDDCSRWCHAACFGIVQGGEVPEFWKCWVCDPTVEVDKERAVKTQKGRLKAMRMKASHATNGGAPGASTVNGIGSNATATADEGTGKPTSRRKTSPGAERKSRRGSAVAAAIEGSGSSRKKRRALTVDPSSPSIPSPNLALAQTLAAASRISHPNGTGSATSNNLPPTPVTFPPDIYPNPSVHTQLLRVAKAWRGVTALNPPSPLIHPPPKTYNDGGYTRVDSQGYRDRHGYSMSPVDNTTPVILDENAGDIYAPRTVLRTDPPVSFSSLHPTASTYSPTHLRPPSPRLHVASDPSPFPHTSIYPSPPISNYMSPPVTSSSHSRSYAKSPLTPSTNTISSNPCDTIPATTLLAPYTAAIIPSAAYLSDPLNGYAHLGMGKPQVKLVGGGWGVGLDARGVGSIPDSSDPGEKGNGVNAGKEDADEGRARWARCGCWPNAVVRPVICNGTKQGRNHMENRRRHRAECAKAAASDGGIVPEGSSTPATPNGRSVPPSMSRMQGHADDASDQDDMPSTSESDTDPTALSFALFALRDLRADEEIVLGWEWDDGHAVHMLPALMESPGMFAPAHLHHLRAQFTSILHALSSTFTTCACGSSTRDCAVRVMERVVEGRWPWPGGDMTSEGSEGESSDVEAPSEDCGGDGCGDEVVDVEGDGGVHPTRYWGLGMNVEMEMDKNVSIEVDGRTRQVKKRKVRKKSKGEKVMACIDEGREASAADSASGFGSTKTKKTIDLGPLVGVKRGFRTREKEPTNGGWGGVEIVPSSLQPFPEVRPEEEGVRVGGQGKGKARETDDNDSIDVDDFPAALPPRMRKAWSQPLTGQSAELPPQDHSSRAEGGGAHERWRSPPEVNSHSPISVSSTPGGSSGQAGHPLGSVTTNGDGEDVTDGQETEFDTETEADGADDARQMPPPPMPASLDPTTVSSLAHAHAVRRSSSPRSSTQRDRNGAPATWIPPRTPTPTSASSGQSSQTPNQGTLTAVPPPPHSVAASQGNHDATSPSTSSLVTQVPIQQPHPPTLISTVSPCAPFSKLSLHSPDALTTPHLSALVGPGESTSATLTHEIRPPSPLVHRPSKPLHVHPQNEPPSLPAILPVSVATSNSPDGTRDTPAEAQYQQAYRSSPESHPSDSDKKRPTNGETHRVRFASPEVLSGLPRLNGKAASDSSEALGPEGVTSSDANTNEPVNEVGCSPNGDLMDVDVDIGDNPMGNEGGALSVALSPETRMAVGSSLLQTLSSPKASSDSLPGHITAEVDNDTAMDSDPSPLALDAHGMFPVEPMNVDIETVEPTREPSPPPLPKVKMSLKDFALRKKKQREEEMAAKALRSPETPDGAVLPCSPMGIDVQRDLSSEHAGTISVDSSGDTVNDHDMKTSNDASHLSGTARVGVNGFDCDSGHEEGIHGRTENRKTKDGKSFSQIQTPTTIVVTKVPDTTPTSLQPSRSQTISPRVSGDKHGTDQVQTQIDDKPPTMTLAAKIEMVDAIVPSGLVGADDRIPDVVSFAPEPPPPPLTIKQTSKSTGIDRTVLTDSAPRSVPPSMPVPTSTPISTSTSTSAVTSRSNSVGISPSMSNLNVPPSSSASIPPSRRPSHEDGEITSSTPPKSYLPRSHTPPTQPRSFHAVHPPSPNFGPTTSSTATTTSRRPVPPLSRSPLSNAGGPGSGPGSSTTSSSMASRPLPSGPRALRGSMAQPTQPPPPIPYPSVRPPPYTSSQYIPRGPSADRDRIDWERDRSWAAPARSRGRAGSNGWGR